MAILQWGCNSLKGKMYVDLLHAPKRKKGRFLICLSWIAINKEDRWRYCVRIRGVIFAHYFGTPRSSLNLVSVYDRCKWISVYVLYMMMFSPIWLCQYQEIMMKLYLWDWQRQVTELLICFGGSFHFSFDSLCNISWKTGETPINQ